MDPIGAACMFNRAAVKPDEKAGDGIVGSSGGSATAFMKVNLNGKRFCNESGPYDYMLHSASVRPSHTLLEPSSTATMSSRSKQMNGWAAAACTRSITAARRT